MSDFKAIATVSWKFKCDKDYLDYARSQLEKILNLSPDGKEYRDFKVQMDMVVLKEKKMLHHLAEFSPEDVFPYVTSEEIKREYKAGDRSYEVRMNSDRYFVFRDNPSCVCCGIMGVKMILDMPPMGKTPHFNFYAEDNGSLILMTKDHKVPKSKGGLNSLSNYQTMCCICNNLKSNSNLDIEELRELREVYDNKRMLPQKALREAINNAREVILNRKRSPC